MGSKKSSGYWMGKWMVVGLLLGGMWFSGEVSVHAGSVTDASVATQYADVSMTLLQKKAQAGDEVAQLELGLRYLRGYEGIQDVIAGVMWIRRSASSGMPQAEHELGALYQMGIGVPRDAHLAVEWFRRGALQGYAPSQTALGFAYENGIGVERDLKKAAYWFGKASASGNGVATESVEAGM